MEITKITISLGAKVPLVQYGSIDPSIFISADLTSEDDPQTCIKELSEMARAELAAMILPIALARLSQTALGDPMFDAVKKWDASKVLRMLMPHIDLSEQVTIGEISVEKAASIAELWGSGTYANGAKEHAD